MVAISRAWYNGSRIYNGRLVNQIPEITLYNDLVFN